MTQRLGPYRVLDRVGSGATGVVYRARDERLDRDVAIKVLSGDTFSDAARTRLRKEARAISRAVHPAIATIHDLASDGGTDFLVMELVPGPTVADRIAKVRSRNARSSTSAGNSRPDCRLHTPPA